MRKIAGAEDGYPKKKMVESFGKGVQAGPEGMHWFRLDGALANEEPEASYRGHARDEGPKENVAIVVVSDLEKPECGQRAGDRANRVHEAFEAEGATVGGGGNVGSEERFLGGRTDAAAEPGGGTREEKMVGARGEGERGS